MLEAIRELERKLGRCTSMVNRLKMHLAKLRMEKDFYKRMHRQNQFEEFQRTLATEDQEYQLECNTITQQQQYQPAVYPHEPVEAPQEQLPVNIH